MGETPLAERADDCTPGSLVGPYRVLRRLASGGMAELFLAQTEVGVSRLVVIKRMHPHMRGDSDFSAMFMREARIAASLEHANTVRVLDAGTLREDPYIVMEYLEGLDLRLVLKRHEAAGLRLGLGRAVRILSDAARGLAYAHSRTDDTGRPQGIVHRDVSPSNLFVTSSGLTKVLDFGIAKATNVTAITAAGIRKGKGCYMAPEQCMGSAVDQRTDVFALGAVLYEATTHVRVFARDNDLAVLHAVTSQAVDPPTEHVPGYPQGLEAVVLKALERHPSERFATAGEFADALDRLADDPQLASSAGDVARMIVELEGSPEPTPRARPGADLAPPMFGTTHRSEGSLLLPTPTNMRQVIDDDSGLALEPPSVTQRTPIPEVSSPSIPAPAPPPEQLPEPPTPTNPTNPTPSAEPQPYESMEFTGVELGAGTRSGRAVWALLAVSVLAAGALAWVLLGPSDDEPSPSTGVAEAPSPEPTPRAKPSAPTAVLDIDAAIVTLGDEELSSLLGFAARHDLIKKVSNSEQAGELNLPLQLYLDLRQAGQSQTPCTTFRGALASLTASGETELRERALKDAKPPTRPGPGEAAAACEGLAAELQPKPPQAEPALPKPTAKPTRSSRKKTSNRPAPAPAPPPEPKPEPPKPKPKPKKRPGNQGAVGKKIDEDLRPMDK